MNNLSTLRDILAFEIEYRAKVPFLKAYKGDTNNMQLTVDYSIWNSIENLEKAAYSVHPDIKNFWKWVKKGLVLRNTEESIIRMQLFNVSFFILNEHKDQLTKWKEQLIAGNTWYYPNCFFNQ